MATAEAAATIAVENPATGEVIRSVPVTSPDGDRRRSSPAPARRSPPGRRSATRAAAGSYKRAQKWLLEHADEVADTIVAETGKAREDALLVEVAYGANALGFWPRKAPKWLADEKVRTLQPVRARPQAWSCATGRSASSA